jgi:hypothetical protein
MGFDKTNRLVARLLGMTPDALMSALRLAQPDELEAVLALRREVLGDALTWDDRAYVAWRYGLGGPSGFADCWVVVREGALLAMVGLEPVTLTAGGQVLHAHVSMDIMVRPSHAGSGLGVWINQALCARHACVLAVGSNPNSRSVIARTFEPLPNRRSWVHPLHFQPFLAKRLKVAVAAALLGTLADVAGVLWRALAWRGRAWGVSVAPVRSIGPEVEALFQRAQQAGRVEVMRDGRQWTRRVFDNPRSQCWVMEARRAGQVVGLVAARQAPGEEGRTTLQLLDLVLDPAHFRAASRALLAAVAAAGYAAGADYLTFTSYDAVLETLLASMPFKFQPHEFETMAWHCADAGFREAVGHSTGWTLTDLHTDRDSA